MKRQRKRNNYSWVMVCLLAILVATITVCVSLLMNPKQDETEAQSSTETADGSSVDSGGRLLLDKTNLQPVVDEWVASVRGKKGVYIYDLDLNQVVGSYHADEVFETASIYKLFVVYEGYKKVESGEWKADAPAGATGYTILECLNLAIRESDSVCAETLWDKIGTEKLEKIIVEDYGLSDTSAEDFSSTPAEVGRMMEMFYRYRGIEDDVVLAQMKDSFINQPNTEYNWRQGLPSGFEVANVYDKVGWEYDDKTGNWRAYNDAAIVEYPEKDRHFVVVVMTSGVGFDQIKRFGQMLEQQILSTY